MKNSDEFITLLKSIFNFIVYIVCMLYIYYVPVNAYHNNTQITNNELGFMIIALMIFISEKINNK